MPVPGVANASFFDIHAPTVSPNGQFAFTADVMINGFPSYSYLFATDPQGVVRLIAGPGSILETAPGMTGQVRRAKLFSDDFAEDAELSQFNSAGQLVFNVDFTDGSSAVFLATLPEPATLSACGLAVFTLHRRARQRRHC